MPQVIALAESNFASENMTQLRCCRLGFVFIFYFLQLFNVDFVSMTDIILYQVYLVVIHSKPGLKFHLTRTFSNVILDNCTVVNAYVVCTIFMNFWKTLLVKHFVFL